MARFVFALFLVGVLSRCGDGSGPSTDVSADLDIATETGVDPATTICGATFTQEPTCEELEAALRAELEQARSCSTHGECLSENDPLCIADGGWYDLTWSSAYDTTRIDCLAEAFWAAGCEGYACDTFGPNPRTACLAEACTQLSESCQADADCGTGQTCVTYEDTGWGVQTNCALCTVDAGTYCNAHPQCPARTLVVSLSPSDPCTLMIQVIDAQGTDELTLDGRVPRRDYTPLPTTKCSLLYEVGSGGAFTLGCPDCGTATYRRMYCPRS